MGQGGWDYGLGTRAGIRGITGIRVGIKGLGPGLPGLRGLGGLGLGLEGLGLGLPGLRLGIQG